ncbi:MAG: (2Fe-2S)-binding protein [Deltaproteobacteria bacterium]|nr:MAG: (2Fe-2S)-binding protein [Deltaproteobacteria bacterium]
MEKVELEIDGRKVQVEAGKTVLEAARRAGIEIPTLCFHERLEPFGACRMCTVEVESGGRKKYVVSCLYPVEPGLVVRTRTEKVDKIRKLVLEYLLARAPYSRVLRELAAEYGADPNRFEREGSFCILCGLCVRYCAEVKGKCVAGFVQNGPRREIAFEPGLAARECGACKECFPLCPTSFAQAAYFLAIAREHESSAENDAASEVA